jgi:transposase
MRYMITDEMWAVIEKCLAKAKIEKRGRPAEISDRKFLEALLYLARTGFPGETCPGNLGNGMRFTTGIVAGSRSR